MSNAIYQVLQKGGVAEIRVGRKQANLSPFERFYLVPIVERERMMRFWRYALVMSAACRNGRTLMQALAKAKEKEIGNVYKLMRRSLPDWCIMVPIAVRNQKHDTWDTSFWAADQRKSEDRRKKARSFEPREGKQPKGKLQYLVSKLWTSKALTNARKSKELVYTGLAEDLMLLGRVEGPMGPPCSLCPRQMLRMMKECDFGDIDCYEYLTSTPDTDGDFKQGAEAAEAAEDSAEVDLGDLGELVIEHSDGTRRVLNVDEVE